MKPGCNGMVITMLVALCAAAPGAPSDADTLAAASDLLTPPELASPGKPDDNTCQRRPLTVNFADLGWSDWIIAPYHYDAGYCSGACLPETLPNTTNHAIVQALVHNVQNTIPKPCCVPTELEPLSVLYFARENVPVLRNYHNMKVKSCGCL